MTESVKNKVSNCTFTAESSRFLVRQANLDYRFVPPAFADLILQAPLCPEIKKPCEVIHQLRTVFYTAYHSIDIARNRDR